MKIRLGSTRKCLTLNWYLVNKRPPSRHSLNFRRAGRALHHGAMLDIYLRSSGILTKEKDV